MVLVGMARAVAEWIHRMQMCEVCERVECSSAHHAEISTGRYRTKSDNAVIGRRYFRRHY
jgi:hypothetical protein